MIKTGKADISGIEHFMRPPVFKKQVILKAATIEAIFPERIRVNFGSLNSSEFFAIHFVHFLPKRIDHDAIFVHVLAIRFILIFCL
ncbi:MAG: hypothetical protein ACHQNE_03490 [Candidatus Kapaibacterium sp.]